MKSDNLVRKLTNQKTLTVTYNNAPTRDMEKRKDSRSATCLHFMPRLTSTPLVGIPQIEVLRWGLGCFKLGSSTAIADDDDGDRGNGPRLGISIGAAANDNATQMVRLGPSRCPIA